VDKGNPGLNFTFLEKNGAILKGEFEWWKPRRYNITSPHPRMAHTATKKGKVKERKKAV